MDILAYVTSSFYFCFLLFFHTDAQDKEVTKKGTST